MKVLLIEDDSQLVKFIEKGLNQAGFSVEIAMDGKTGLNMALEIDVDVAVIDIMLPLMDGFTLIQEIRKSRSELPILVLSAKRSVEDRVRGLEIGSDDYLTKPFSFTELIARIRALVRRTGAHPEATKVEVSDLSLDFLSREVRKGRESIDLLPKEFALLEYFVRNKGRVLTRTQILEQVWGYQFDPESNVVDVHICRLREKLDDTGERRLIRTIRGVGYVLKEDE
ncbi:MAG: response regulator transcription factor [Desulfatiglandaceae bacterium]|jgi:DNA-binding response OmpR family regulator